MATRETDAADTVDTYEYATYAPTPEICPSCCMPIPAGQLTRRGMFARQDGPAVVAYWHTRCVRADGSR
ncbi:hypothetical protein [Streptomyces sp. NBC_00239]|uniref:hypothetical protein n=1 Tax=Streptomyces sp. NBC_00239 TaxID=2903640 RepID=UPI002E289AE2|nr:hypothetical protein [Streptomyces sp. NBC_00239]